MRHAVMLVLSMTVLLSGCATSGGGSSGGGRGGGSYARAAGSETVDMLEIAAPRASGKVYYLFDGSRQPISRAESLGGQLRFVLPRDQYVNECVAVFDDRGNPLPDDRRKFRLSLRFEHQEAWRQKQSIKTDSEAAAATERRVRQQRGTLESRLGANPSYASGVCRRLLPQPAPPRPRVRCERYDECLQDGAMICYTSYFGAKGCGLALDEFKISGLLSSPGCAAAAAQIAGEKYDLGDAVVDALHGAIADIGKDMMRSEAFLDQLLGLVITLGNEYTQYERAKTCAVRFAEREFAPLRAWSAQIDQIRAEPEQLLADCTRDVAELRRVGQPPAAPPITDVTARLRALDSRIAQLEQERRAVNWCGI
jgi:hypothetical protein